MVFRFTPEERADIGRYAQLNGVATTARYYSRKLGIRLSESTVQHDDNDVVSVPLKKRGRLPLLGEDLDAKVQLYLKNVRKGGGVESSRIAMAAARGVLFSYDKYRLAEFGGPVLLNRHWASFLLSRMNCRKEGYYRQE